MLNIYKVVWPEASQECNRYLSFLVVCETEEQARNTHPGARPAIGGSTPSEHFYGSQMLDSGWPKDKDDWIPHNQREMLEVCLIGTAAEGMGPGVVHYSFLQG